MNIKKKSADWPESERIEPELAQALQYFKSSIDARSERWSGVSSVAHPALPTRSHGWRLALGGVLGCLLVAGALTLAVVRTGGHGETHSVPRVTAGASDTPAEQADAVPATIPHTADAVADANNNKIAQAVRELAAVQELLLREAGQDRLAGDGIASDDDLLAAVGNDLTRQVPTVMEPLAQLAAADGPE